MLCVGIEKFHLSVGEQCAREGKDLWWGRLNLSVGAQITHKTRGVGTIVHLETNGLQVSFFLKKNLYVHDN